MSVARVTELSAISETGFEDAINEAVARATKTLRGVEGAWVKDMNVLIEDGNIRGRANRYVRDQREKRTRMLDHSGSYLSFPIRRSVPCARPPTIHP